MTLTELQASFQEAILNAAQPVPMSVMPSRRQSSAERFEIYRDAYRLRLTEFLSNDYPVLRMVLGDEAFEALAAAFIDATPSLHRNARWYGRGLPDFIRENAVWSETRAVADLAFFERALSDAFDAADNETIQAGALAAVAAEDQPQLRFIFQDGLTLLTLAQGIVDAHQAVNENQDVSAPSETSEETVLVWRDASQQAFYRVLAEDEALALDSANLGGTFGEICGLLSLRMPEETAANEAAVFLIRWFADGLITGFRL